MGDAPVNALLGEKIGAWDVQAFVHYLRDKGWRALADLKGKAVTQVEDWGNLDLNYKVVARIDPDTCIRCNLCHVACEDGAHQCITPAAPQDDGRVLAPVVDETECVCNHPATQIRALGWEQMGSSGPNGISFPSDGYPNHPNRIRDS